jgi:pilus assembly protein Flp/PilA
MLSQFRTAAIDFLRSEDGPTAVEYAIMLAFIFAVCFGAIGSLGTTTQGALGNNALNTAAS